jgi:hypothetical protein
MPTFRIAITVVNPGYEGTDAALGLLSLDFEDEEIFKQMDGIAKNELIFAQTKNHSFFIRNEKGQSLMFNHKFYHSYWSGPVDNWEEPKWSLSAEGDPPPQRESI